MILTLQAVQIANRHDSEGRLVFCDGRLLALLVRLSDLHDEHAGEWFLEFAFDALENPPNVIFPDLDTGLGWIRERLAHVN